MRFYFNGSPNPTKVALLLEEAGLHYEPVPIDVAKGDQFSSEYQAINPNGKVPALQDGEIVVFDSNAILLYLAEKTGQFLPSSEHRGEMLSWLMFIASGLGPFAGQAVHFEKFAPETPYARDRYNYELRRHLSVLDARLRSRKYIVGDSYSIVDMAAWGWLCFADFILGDGELSRFGDLERLVDEINSRPAAQRALALKDEFVFQPLDSANARSNMFRHTEGR